MVSVLADRHEEIERLCAKYGVQRLEVFGSAASEQDFNPQSSDVDFIVEFLPGQSLGPWLGKYFELRDALSELVGYPVDLVMSSAIKNPYFAREASRTRQLLYGA